MVDGLIYCVFRAWCVCVCVCVYVCVCVFEGVDEEGVRVCIPGTRSGRGTIACSQPRQGLPTRGSYYHSPSQGGRRQGRLSPSLWIVDLRQPLPLPLHLCLCLCLHLCLCLCLPLCQLCR